MGWGLWSLLLQKWIYCGTGLNNSVLFISVLFRPQCFWRNNMLLYFFTLEWQLLLLRLPFHRSGGLFLPTTFTEGAGLTCSCWPLPVVLYLDYINDITLHPSSPMTTRLTSKHPAKVVVSCGFMTFIFVFLQRWSYPCLNTKNSSGDILVLSLQACISAFLRSHSNGKGQKHNWNHRIV